MQAHPGPLLAAQDGPRPVGTRPVGFTRLRVERDHGDHTDVAALREERATRCRARLVLALTANMSARLADTLERCVPAILQEWERRASAGELRSLCQSDRAGDLAAVLRAICAALDPSPVAGAVDAFIEIAAAHGARRRVQGVHEACLLEEYDFLGAAVPHALRECRIAPLAPQDLLELEGALTTAILAGLRGYHRGEFERRGTWADALARTASDSTDLGTASAVPRRPAGDQTKFGS